MEHEAKIKIPKLMKKFIEDIKHQHSAADVSVRNADDESLVFEELTTQAMWLGYQLGYKQAKRTEPGWSFIAKITDSGLEISENPRGIWHLAHAAKVTRSCESNFGGKFIFFSLTRAAYTRLKVELKDNKNIIWHSGEISKIPFLIRNEKDTM